MALEEDKDRPELGDLCDQRDVRDQWDVPTCLQTKSSPREGC